VADDPRDLTDGALAAAFRSPRASGTHLTEAEWERLTCDEMTAAERDTALGHIMSCAECTTIHRSLMQLREGATEIEQQRPRNNAGTNYRRWSIAGGLVTAAAIVAAVLINQPTRVVPDNVMRSGTETTAITVLSPRANEPAVDRRFSWQGVSGATSYELRVTTQDGVRVFTSRRDETFAELPAEIEVKSGTYYWRVVAFKGETEVAASTLIPFTLTAR
jgi:hypothetical protein